MENLKIEYVPIDSVEPYSKNAKLHPAEQIEQIKKSILDYGFRDPVGVWKGQIVEGHGRVIAARELGLTEIPIIRLDDMTDEQRREYALVHNQTTMNSGFDFSILDDELEDLPDFDAEFYGFEFPQIEEETQIVEDEVPEQVKTRCKSGDLWKLGNHRLICGDSTDKENIAKLMGGGLADLVFTDPPYGVAIGDKNKALNSVQKAGRCTENISGDTMSEEELYEMLKKAFINVRDNCNEDASYYVTSPQGGSLGLMMMMMMRDAGLQVRHVLMWEKNTATFSLGRLDYDYQHEPIFYTWTKSHHNYRKGNFRTTIWKVDKPRKCDLHPTMKPIELIVNAILDGTKENDRVLDVFGGSGSTLIACEQTGRNCFMSEIDPHYCDVIIQRWENFTGNKAVKIED